MFQPHGYGPMRLMKDALVDCFANGLHGNDVLVMPPPWWPNCSPRTGRWRPREPSLCSRLGTVGRDPDGISAQIFRRGYAAGRRIQRSSLALAACASVPPRRARSDILHRSLDTGMLLAWVDHNTRQKPVPRPWRRFGCWAAYTTRLCRRNARSARFTGLEMRLADDRPITTYRDGRHADFTRRGGPEPDHYSAATVSRVAGADRCSTARRPRRL